TGEDRRAAGQTCSLLLAFAGGRTSDAAAVRGDAGPDRAATDTDGIASWWRSQSRKICLQQVGARRGVAKVCRKWAISGCAGGGRHTVGSAPDDKSFHSVANRRDECTMVPFLRPKRKFRLIQKESNLDIRIYPYAFFQRFRAKALLLPIVSPIILCLIACGGTGSPSGSNPLSRLQHTSISSTQNPLVAEYSVTTTGPGTVTIEFGPTTSYGFKTAPYSMPSGGGSAILQVAGMKQNTLHHMRAILATANGQVVDQDHTFQTGAIPSAMMPVMHVTTPQGQTPTPGVQLVSFSGESFAVNPAGDIVWFYNYQESTGGPWLVKLLPNGHMLMILNLPGATSGIREVDLAGNTIRELDLSDLSQKLTNAGYNLQLTAIDHDVLVMPNGHWLFITSNTRVFTDLPGYPGQTTVVGNAIIDVDQNNNPVWVWDAFDHLDVNRHPMNFPDWTHANALFYVPEDGSVLLSIRHQHWIVKIDYANGSGSGDIVWKLGHEGDFTLLDSNSPADWFY